MRMHLACPFFVSIVLLREPAPAGLVAHSERKPNVKYRPADHHTNYALQTFILKPVP